MNWWQKLLLFIRKLFGKDTYEPDQTEFVDNQPLTSLISSSVLHNNAPGFVYYKTIAEASAYIHSDTLKYVNYIDDSTILRPFWDIRYVNPVSKFSTLIDYTPYTGLNSISGLTFGTEISKYDASGSLAQNTLGTSIAGGSTINLYNAPEQDLEYSGPQITFLYLLGNRSTTELPQSLTKPWQDNKNLCLQANFYTPMYTNFENNDGGGLNFNIFLYNRKLNLHINYVIGVYSFGGGWTEEQDNLKFDTTTNIVHVATVIKPNTIWSTKSPYSAETSLINYASSPRIISFFRINITEHNIMNVLTEINSGNLDEVQENYGTSPEDWEVTLLGIQSELEEQGGKAILAGSFRGFEVYSSDLPL